MDNLTINNDEAKKSVYSLVYCRKTNGEVYRRGNTDSCKVTTDSLITKTEYERLKSKRISSSRTQVTSSSLKFCRRSDGGIHQTWNSCDPGVEITKAKYERLKKTGTVSNMGDDSTQTNAENHATRNSNSIESKLEKLKRLLDKGLITDEEAKSKRVKLLDEL